MIIHVAKMRKKPCPSADEWTSKMRYIHSYNKLLFSLKTEGHFHVYCNRDKHGGHYARRNKPVTERQMRYVE